MDYRFTLQINFEARKEVGMIKTVLVAIAIVVSFSNAAEFQLLAKTVCSSDDGLEFKCKPTNQGVVRIIKRGNDWFGMNGKDSVKLGIIKDDPYITILNNPVFYSGMESIHLMKVTSTFYWSKISYSEILKQSNVTIEYGDVSQAK